MNVFHNKLLINLKVYKKVLLFIHIYNMVKEKIVPEGQMKSFMVLLLGLLLCGQAAAKESSEVLVPVDVEAENSVMAKEKAMLEAQRTAFISVAEKLAGSENTEKLQEHTDNEILHFIQSVSVADEKSGGTKYKANLTVRVNEDLLKEYLAENDMYKEEASSLLVIPVFREKIYTVPQLWESSNTWLKSWKEKGLIKFGTMQINTLSPMYHKISELNAESALYMGADLYEQLSNMSGTDRIYVVYAEIQSNGDIKVTVKNEKNKSEDSFSVYNDDDAEIFDKAIEKSVMFVSNMERDAKNQKGIETSGTINAVYVYQNMKDWLMKNTAITSLPQVEGIDTKSFGGGKVNFTIKYTGAIDDLWAALQEIGLSHESAGNYFIIR